MFQPAYDTSKSQFIPSESLSFPSWDTSHMIHPNPIGNASSVSYSDATDPVSSPVIVGGSISTTADPSGALSSNSVTTLNYTSSSTPNIPFGYFYELIHVSSGTLTIPISNSPDSRYSSIYNSSILHINQLNEYHMVNIAKACHSKPKTLLAHVEPTSVKQALSHPDCSKAMQIKYESFQGEMKSRWNY